MTARRLDEAGLDDLRFARKVARLHALGARTHYEFLHEIGRRHGIRTAIEGLLDRYVDHLTVEMLRAVGGDRFPPPPIHLVADSERR